MQIFLHDLMKRSVRQLGCVSHLNRITKPKL